MPVEISSPMEVEPLNRRYIFLVIVVVAALLVGLYLYPSLQYPSSTETYEDIDIHTARSMIEEREDLVILDVRGEDEFLGGHIEGATLIPVGELEAWIGELDKGADILVYCGSGARSARAARILVEGGFTKVYNMMGGIIAWEEAGYPTVSGY